jgi:uncharacterized DUF497 family protein
MVFEYDSNKSNLNRQKHGIDFEKAQLLWNDSRRIEIEARTVGEQRILLIGEIEGEIWPAIFTFRKSNIRLISARKARKARINEKEIYYHSGI